MKRRTILRTLASLCLIIGGIGYLVRGEYLLGGIFAAAAAAILVSIFVGQKEK